MKLSEMRKTENRLNPWFCSCFVSLTSWTKCYYDDIQTINHL